MIASLILVSRVIYDLDPVFAFDNQLSETELLDRTVIVPGVRGVGKEGDQIHLA
jgi:hypothetical protein